MSYNIVFPRGEAIDITIPATESIAIKTLDGQVDVFRTQGYPNLPDQEDKIGTVGSRGVGGESTFGAYASGATIRIKGNASQVMYAVGVAPVISDDGAYQVQGAPNAVNATATLTDAQMLGGIITSTTAAAVAATVRTGTQLDAASEFAVNDSFDLAVINTGGANAWTLTAATGITIVGAAAVAASSSGIFRFRKTAANTFVAYRIG